MLKACRYTTKLQRKFDQRVLKHMSKRSVKRKGMSNIAIIDGFNLVMELFYRHVLVFEAPRHLTG